MLSSRSTLYRFGARRRRVVINLLAQPAAAAVPPGALTPQIPPSPPLLSPSNDTQHTLNTDNDLHTSDLNIAHVNCNSITAENRLSELEMFLSMNSIDIVCLTETKLDSNVNQSLYSLDGYHDALARHRDRHGGGVAVLVKDTIAVKRLPDLELSDIEWIWFLIKTETATIVISTVYLPPSLTAAQHNDFLQKLNDSVADAQRLSADCIVILGDFNAGSNFLTQQFTNHSPISSFEHKLKDEIISLDMQQLITEPTRLSNNVANLRDLIIVSNPLIVKRSGIMSPFSKIDHFPVFLTLNVTPPSRTIETRQLWDYRRMDSDKLVRRILDTDWDSVLDGDIDSATTKLTETLLNAANEAIPRRQVMTKNYDKPWVTADLKKQIRKRDRLFRLARKRDTDSDWNRWRRQRNMTTDLNKRLKDSYVQNQAHKLLETKHNAHKYHNILKDMIGKKRKQSIPPLIDSNGSPVIDDIEKANILNHFFADQTKLDTTDKRPPNIDPPAHPPPQLQEVQVTEPEVLKALNSLKVNKSTGPDEIPTKLLKMTALLIAAPLTKLFNKILQAGLYPTSWKIATVTAIYKRKGSSSDPSNYRPISLLSCLSKVLEKLVFGKIYKHLTDNNILPDKQSGYRPGHSTQMQLLYLTHQLYSALDQNLDFTTVYLDIRKYFDRIWHEALLLKCEFHCGITGTLLHWLKSYLSDRSQIVKIGNAFSKPQKLSAGVPQGSVLGPLLALIYLSDLSDTTVNDILYYADDSTLYTSHPHDSPLHQSSLQQDLDTILRFGTDWAISFSGPKTIQQTFTTKQEKRAPQLSFDGQRIQPVPSHKHLGLTLSTDLRFHDHVNTVIKTINSQLGPVYAVAKFLPRKVLCDIYKTYIQPHFDYCDVIYDCNISIADTTRLQTLHNRIARLITGTMKRSSTDRLLDELGWVRLQTRRKMHRLTYFHRLFYNNPPLPSYICSILPDKRCNTVDVTLRNASSLTTCKTRLSSFHKSFVPSTTRLWNQLPESVRQTRPENSFGKLIRGQFGNLPPPEFYSEGTKIGNILHTQLRVGLSPLNAHRYATFNDIPTPACLCGFHHENTKHFVLFCPRYSQARTRMLKSVELFAPDFNLFTLQQKIDALLFGNGIKVIYQTRVAELFQTFLLRSKRFSLDKTQSLTSQ